MNSNEYPVEFVGLNNKSYTDMAKSEWEKIIKKFARKIKEPLSLKVHTKEYHKEGAQSKFSITLHMHIAQVSKTTNADNWDIQVALKEAFEALETELSKKF